MTPYRMMSWISSFNRRRSLASISSACWKRLSPISTQGLLTWKTLIWRHTYELLNSKSCALSMGSCLKEMIKIYSRWRICLGSISETYLIATNPWTMRLSKSWCAQLKNSQILASASTMNTEVNLTSLSFLKTTTSWDSPKTVSLRKKLKIP